MMLFTALGKTSGGTSLGEGNGDSGLRYVKSEKPNQHSSRDVEKTMGHPSLEFRKLSRLEI